MTQEPPEGHVTENRWLHELVSAEIGQGGSPVNYGITWTWTLGPPAVSQSVLMHSQWRAEMANPCVR